jgi:hypothetical protein
MRYFEHTSTPYDGGVRTLMRASARPGRHTWGVEIHDTWSYNGTYHRYQFPLIRATFENDPGEGIRDAPKVAISPRVDGYVTYKGKLESAWWHGTNVYIRRMVREARVSRTNTPNLKP